MQISRRVAMTAAAAAISVAAIAPARADGITINVSLWDKGDASFDLMDKNGPMLIGATSADQLTDAPMGVTLDQGVVKAGEITFNVTNTSESMVHEMVISPLPDPVAGLPYSAEDDEVNEDAAGSPGEVEELDPGTSGKLTLRLEPGTYALYCNVPGHYAMGMWAILTVQG